MSDDEIRFVPTIEGARPAVDSEGRQVWSVPIDGAMLIAMTRELEWKRRAVSIAIEQLQPLCMCMCRGHGVNVHVDECPVAQVINAASGLG